MAFVMMLRFRHNKAIVLLRTPVGEILDHHGGFLIVASHDGKLYTSVRAISKFCRSRHSFLLPFDGHSVRGNNRSPLRGVNMSEHFRCSVDLFLCRAWLEREYSLFHLPLAEISAEIAGNPYLHPV